MLIISIGADAGWIAFDVVISIVTYPLMPTWEWLIFAGCGVALIILSTAAQILQFKASQRDEKRHTHEHDVLAQGSIAVLAALTRTSGQPVSNVLTAATEQIQNLQTEISDVAQFFWRRINVNDQVSMVALLKNLGPRTVRIASDPQTDCMELGRSLCRIFRSAGWVVEPEDVTTGSWEVSGVSSIVVHVKSNDIIQLGPRLLDVLRVFLNTSPTAWVRDLGTQETVDVVVVIGPKVSRES